MTKLVLYGVAVSAFVAKVRVVLDHKGLEFEEIPPPDGYGSAAYREIIPAGSVPGLTADGIPLHDSTAIMEFLDDLAPTPGLRPDAPLDRAHMRALIGFHDTRLEAAARQLFPIVKTGGDSAPGLTAISAALARLEELIAQHQRAPYLFGGHPSLADLAYPCTLQMAEMMAAELGNPLILPAGVADWRSDSAKLPAVARSLAIAGDAMEAWMAGFR